MKLECETVVLRAYLRKLNMSDALAEKAAFEAEQERLKKLEEAELQRRKEEQLARDTALITETYLSPAQLDVQTEVAETITVPPPEEPKTIDVRFYDTFAAFRANMKAICIKHNIRYGGIK